MSRPRFDAGVESLISQLEREGVLREADIERFLLDCAQLFYGLTEHEPDVAYEVARDAFLGGALIGFMQGWKQSFNRNSYGDPEHVIVILATAYEGMKVLGLPLAIAAHAATKTGQPLMEIARVLKLRAHDVVEKLASVFPSVTPNGERWRRLRNGLDHNQVIVDQRDGVVRLLSEPYVTYTLAEVKTLGLHVAVFQILLILVTFDFFLPPTKNVVSRALTEMELPLEEFVRLAKQASLTPADFGVENWEERPRSEWQAELLEVLQGKFRVALSKRPKPYLVVRDQANRMVIDLRELPPGAPYPSELLPHLPKASPTVRLMECPACKRAGIPGARGLTYMGFEAWIVFHMVILLEGVPPLVTQFCQGFGALATTSEGKAE